MYFIIRAEHASRIGLIVDDGRGENSKKKKNVSPCVCMTDCTTRELKESIHILISTITYVVK